MSIIFILLLIAHFLADFYLQSNESVVTKEDEKIFTRNFFKTETFKHIMIYLILSSLIFVFYKSENVFAYLFVIAGLLLHGLIDIIKTRIIKKNNEKTFLEEQKKNILKPLLFIVDQALHIGILYYLSIYIDDNFAALNWHNLDFTYLIYLLALILIGKTANVTFRVLFKNYEPINKKEDKGHENAGGWIGILERIIVLMLITTGHIAAIGFIVAAKSIVRFKKFEDSQFGEYFIIGTLFSVIYAFLVYFALFS